MGQYRLWLQHREVDQDLRTQQAAYEQELTEIDEHIARIEQTTMHTSNALLTALMQQIHGQKQSISERVDETYIQTNYNGRIHSVVEGQIYHVPSPSIYGQSSTSVSPALLAWSQLPNFDTHEIHISEEHSLPENALPILPDVTDHLLPSDLNSVLEQDLQKDGQRSLPWWLRNIMKSAQEEQEPQKTAPIDPQSMRTNQRVERWFARRNKLAHRNEWQEGQK